MIPLKKRDKRIGYFYIKTNGAALTLELALTLIELYALCDESEFEPGESSCMLQVSQDQFHWGANEIHPVFNALKFFSLEELRSDAPRFDGIIKEGRAYDLGIGQRSPKEVRPFEIEEDDEDLTVEQIYVGETGDVISLCDISYERFEEEKQGNILETPLIDILKAQINREMEEAA